ncbi:alpha/beta fold hydrolase [Microbacterium aoyamense]|uniref:Alpha/beta fold hydrolase n=1 Tax=Microbacterium aoyamense TaxID=344166 RepID=A0ABN2PTR2_9MICO|nr:alpha/beta hydrolase [Microbacterium aoyamense]
MTLANPYAPLLDAIPVERREVEVMGSTTVYWVYGPDDAETTILAVHGYRGEHHGLEPIVAHLPGTRVISPDLPGFGETPPIPGRTHDLDTYVAWLTAFSAATAQGAVLIGHSFGSIVSAAAVAAGLPTPRLVLINPIGAPALEGSKGFLTRLAIVYYQVGAKLPESVGDKLLRSKAVVRIMSASMTNSKDPAIRRFVRDQHDLYFSRFSDRTVLHEGFLASVSNDVRVSAPLIDVPTLLIAAQEDEITNIDDVRRLATLFADVELVEIPNVGHLIHYETPQVAASAIMRFVAPSAPGTR